MLSILELTMKNQTRYAFTVRNEVAEAIARNHAKGGVVFAINGGQCLSVDLKDVVGILVNPLQIAKAKPQEYRDPKPVSTPREQPAESPTAEKPETESKKALFKFECKCGAEYFAALYENAQKCRCRECGEALYVDRFAPKRKNETGDEATLVTNRYRVPFADKE